VSIAIDTDKVTNVLINSVWYAVKGSSFYLDAYEYLDGSIISSHPQCSTGFSFDTTEGDIMSGPITAIKAVRHTR